MTDDVKRRLDALCSMYDSLSKRAAAADADGTVLFETKALAADAGTCSGIRSLIGEAAWETALAAAASDTPVHMTAVVAGDRVSARVIPYCGIAVIEIGAPEKKRGYEEIASGAYRFAEREARGAITTMLAALENVESSFAETDERSKKSAAVMRHNIMKLMRVMPGVNIPPELSVRPDNASYAARKICDQVREIYGRLGLMLIDDIPTAPLTAVFDRSYFERMLFSLFACAAKFSDKGRTVTFRLTGGEDVTCVLHDPYQWFENEHRFFINREMESEIGEADGELDMDIAAAASAAEAHGGTLEIDCSGDGITVTVRLPRGTSPDVVKAFVPEINAGLNSALIWMSGVLGSDFYYKK